MSKWTWSYAYWGIGWLFVGFLVPELAGYFRWAPWTTFSETVWHATRYPFVGPAVFATLVFLCVHFLYHRPLWHSVLFGLAIAAAAHWLNKSL